MADENRLPGFWQTIPGILTALAGIITAVAGLLLALYQTGMLGGGKSPTANDINKVTISSQPSATGSAGTEPASQPTKTAGPTRTEPDLVTTVDISGEWYDTEGVQYSISQNGNQFRGRAIYGNVISVGGGHLSGREYILEYSSNRPSQGRCRGTVSTDGNSIVSECWDSAVGNFPVKMMRR